MAGVALPVCKEEPWSIMETKIHSPECGNSGPERAGDLLWVTQQVSSRAGQPLRAPQLSFFPLLLKLALIEYLLCSRYNSSSLYVFSHLILQQPYYKVGIIFIPILEMKKLKLGMVSNLAKAT